MIENHVLHLVAWGEPGPAGLAQARAHPRPLARPPACARARDLEKPAPRPLPRGVPPHTHGDFRGRDRAGAGTTRRAIGSRGAGTLAGGPAGAGARA